VIAEDLDSFAEDLLPGSANYASCGAGFFYVAAQQLFTHRFYPWNINPDLEPYLRKLCAEQMEFLMGVPATATKTRAWKIDANYTVYPLRNRDQMVGLLGLELNGGSDPSSKLWDRYMQILGSSLSRLATLRRSERQLMHLNNYLTVSSLLAQSLGLHDMLEATLYCCMEMVSAEAATVLLLDDTKENFLFYQVEGPAKPVLSASAFPVDRGIAGSVLASGHSEVINQVREDPRFFGKIDTKSGFVTRNMIALPLTAGEEQVGVLEVLNKVDNLDFTEEEHLSLMMIAEEVAFAIRNARIFEYVVDSYCIQRQGLNTCRGCKRPLGSWTPCVKYREAEL
jgi:hypothetical protein